MTLKKIPLFFFAVIILSLINSVAYAETNFYFYPEKINVKEGQIFKININVDPVGIKNHTIKTNIKFPSDLIKISTWSYGINWMPIKKSGYDYFSNIEGVLIRAADYPEGFDKKIFFGTATFIAQKTGSGTIEFLGEQLALGENDVNFYKSGNEVNLKIEELESVNAIEEAPSGEQPPEQLFDINLEIDQVKVSKIEDLSSRVVFVSFGRIPIPVDLTFDILDSDGKVIHSENGNIIVETEGVYRKSFSGFSLPDGHYILRLSLFYNTKIHNNFKRDFNIISNAEKSSHKIELFCCLVILALSLLILSAFFIKKCKKH